MIKNGRVIDPFQRIDSKLNILIEDGKIAALTCGDAAADNVIDAAGKIVCPGFIDIHAHEDPVIDGRIFSDAEKANLACLLKMGVTTALTGNCGDNFSDPSSFIKLAESEGCFTNVIMLAGYTYFREKYSKADNYTPAAEEEIRSISAAIAGALDSGCAGVSFGLEYVPGMSGDELKAAASLCTGRDRLVSAHIRDCAEKACPALQEITDICAQAQVPLQISHIGSMAGYGQMEQFLRLLDEYRAAGVDVTCDCYPYDAFSTFIGSAPYDDLESIHCSYEDIEMCEGEFKGQRCTKEIFEAERKAHPDYLTVGHVMHDEDIIMAYAHPGVMVGSDCFLNNGQGHPRAAGAFPRFLSRYAKKSGLSLSEAVSRMTSLPAERLGLKNKGNLMPGSDADIVIFDPEHLKDCATFMSPLLPPEGISRVLIAGQTAVCDGRIINPSLGTAIRK